MHRQYLCSWVGGKHTVPSYTITHTVVIALSPLLEMGWVSLSRVHIPFSLGSPASTIHNVEFLALVSHFFLQINLGTRFHPNFMVQTLSNE